MDLPKPGVTPPAAAMASASCTRRRLRSAFCSRHFALWCWSQPSKSSFLSGHAPNASSVSRAISTGSIASRLLRTAPVARPGVGPDPGTARDATAQVSGVVGTPPGAASSAAPRKNRWTLGPDVLPMSVPGAPPAMSSMSSSSPGPFLPGVVVWSNAGALGSLAASSLRSCCAPKRSASLRCLNLSSFSRSILWSQSGWMTRGQGLTTCWSAAGMLMIFWMAFARRCL